ncbi:TM2 domain-containing protein [Methylomarinum sp. Ch1-1]|uniref:TM2 domain-containing protein n=1 Tax=Methylomarinum roseum TaxID=3067653 RepID=A0AAU7NVJ2_9GAMM|nr:TM2 domain-containing protein [Methylomarinum sp. Ch1-1]MDP4523009.1 TM2 domain-containing protein [Methylomarinum sp. Ch1-1]
MIGHIESYDDNTQTGVIKFEDKFYEFHIDQWTLDSPPKVGDDVDFDMDDDDTVTEVGPVGAYLKDTRPVKRRWVAVVLGFLFGAIGLHRIYLGFYGLGIAQILVTLITGGYGVVWGFTEAVLLLTGHIYKDAKGRFLK